MKKKKNLKKRIIKRVIVCESFINIPTKWVKYLGKGMNPNVYLIPTIDKKGRYLPPSRIGYYLSQFYYATSSNPYIRYLVSKSLAARLKIIRHSANIIIK